MGRGKINMNTTKVSPEEFLFEKAVVTIVFPADGDVEQDVYLTAENQYTTVPLSEMPRYVQRLTIEGRTTLQRELRKYIEIIEDSSSIKAESLGKRYSDETKREFLSDMSLKGANYKQGDAEIARKLLEAV